MGCGATKEEPKWYWATGPMDNAALEVAELIDHDLTFFGPNGYA